ncbi:hypothetical protein [Streptomyces sp. NPDC001083]|uniref:hypothetical protein n=1 Tax=Streptomyces sp. NPDC001083 TaxID=3364545 RepID=UPI0036937D2D
MSPIPQQRHGYRREMSAGEWLYAGLAPRDSNTVQYVVEGAGTMDASRLADAVARASEACPGTRLVRDGRRLVDGGVPPRVRVMEAGSFDAGLLDSPALRHALRSPDATFEVLLFPGGGGVPDSAGASVTLVFRASHGVTDARGLMLWIEDVFRVLRGSEPAGAPSTLSRDEFLRDLDLPGGLPPAARNVSGLAWPSPLGRLPRRPAGTLWRRRSVDGSHPAATAASWYPSTCAGTRPASGPRPGCRRRSCWTSRPGTAGRRCTAAPSRPSPRARNWPSARTRGCSGPRCR